MKTLSIQMQNALRLIDEGAGFEDVSKILKTVSALCLLNSAKIDEQIQNNADEIY